MSETHRNERHTVTLDRDRDRMGGHYGEWWYVERVGFGVVKYDHLGRNRESAENVSRCAARIYGAEFRLAPGADSWHDCD